MARSKDKSEVERLKGIIRNQDKVIKQLRKQATRANNKKKNTDVELDEVRTVLQDYLLEEEQAKVNAPEVHACPDCQGKLDTVNLGVRIIVHCSTCGYRKVTKSGKS